MTDERDPRAPETPEAAPASDLPTPSEDRSATTPAAEGESPRPSKGEAAEAAAGEEGAASGEGEAAAPRRDATDEASVEEQGVAAREEDAASEASASGPEETTEPLGEGETGAAAAEPATADGGGAAEEGSSEEAAVAAENTGMPSPPTAASTELPEGDAASASEDDSRRSGEAESPGAAPGSVDVSVETSSEPPPSPESVPSPAPGSSPEPRTATAEAPVASEEPTAAAAEPAAAEEAEPETRAAAESETPAAEAEAPAAAEAEPEPQAAAAEEPTTGEAKPAPAAAEAEPEKPPAKAAPEEPEDPAVAELRRAKEEGTTVEGKVIGWNRGGFHVVVGEITAFCPSSEMELGRPRNPQSYVDRELRFRVVKLQKKGRRVVLSRAAVLGEERQRVVGELAAGGVVRGRVTSLPDFGAFVDLGGVEGLVHVSEISRGRVKSPKEALQVGQEVEVKVLKVEQDGERISLSMKDLEPDPWQGVAERYSRGEKFPGKVARRADFGLFVELEPEVEGLVHVSQLPPGTELGDPSLDPGRTIDVWVREVDRKRQRIALSLREVPSEDPWKSAAKRFPEGEMVEGTVESIAPFGVFVNLAPGLTGLLPGSQTGLPKGTSAARAFTPGQKVRVQVLSIDSRRKRISLGREGSRVEATRGDLQEFKKQQREREQEAPTAMAAAFARLREDREGPETS